MTVPPIPTHPFSPKRVVDIPFEIMRCETLPPIATIPRPHRHTFYEIFWITGGSGTHNIDFEARSIIQNTLYFITPGQVHFWEIEEPIAGYAILFTQDFIATNFLEQITLQSFDFYHHTTQQPLIHIGDEYATDFTAICEAMLSEYQGQHYGRFTLLQCQLTSLLIHAQRHYVERSPSALVSTGDELIRHYLQLIDEHFREIQNVGEYAHLLSITPGHLRDTARQHSGVSPAQLLNNRIALEAKRLIVHSTQTIAEIGQHLNFEDPSYFSRFFKRETGTTPSAFRQKFREKYQNPHA